jgi:hypothetical protein
VTASHTTESGLSLAGEEGLSFDIGTEHASHVGNVGAKGLLFIGDPHLSSRKPGRRTDTDFAGTVLDKLDQAFTLARKAALQPVILGDLFDRAGEHDLHLLSRLLALLARHAKEGGIIPVTLVGNHDMRDTELSGDTTLSVVRESGLIRVFDSVRPFFVQGEPETINGETFMDPVAVLLPFSYGQEDVLLAGVSGLLKEAPNDVPVIALTHADFAFQGAYPGAKEMKAIPGVQMVVNGHMHKLTPAVRRGDTLWWNPGNITRMSVDCEGHPPRVWVWRPGDDALTGVELRHEKTVFNRAGIAVDADDAGLKDALQDIPVSSRFVEMLKAQKAQEAPLTDDASGLLTELEAVCTERKVDPVVMRILHGLVQDGCLLDARAA